jgi:hypothetical protein
MCTEEAINWRSAKLFLSVFLTTVELNEQGGKLLPPCSFTGQLTACGIFFFLVINTGALLIVI